MASGAELVERETSWDHISALESVVLGNGVPYAYYTDSHSIFRFVPCAAALFWGPFVWAAGGQGLPGTNPSPPSRVAQIEGSPPRRFVEDPCRYFQVAALQYPPPRQVARRDYVDWLRTCFERDRDLRSARDHDRVVAIGEHVRAALGGRTRGRDVRQVLPRQHQAG